MKPKAYNPTRRHFLLTAAAVPAIGVAVIASSARENPAAVPGQTVREDHSGRYHETDHIRKYYYTAAYF